MWGEWRLPFLGVARGCNGRRGGVGGGHRSRRGGTRACLRGDGGGRRLRWAGNMVN